MLTENEVIEAVCTYLLETGYEITQKLNTKQTGIDIIASSSRGIKCYVEAKGATSSKSESSKFGKEFSLSQVKVHIGVALVAAFKVANEFQNSESLIAVPNNSNHRTLIDKMRIPINKSGIGVLLVDYDGSVEKYV